MGWTITRSLDGFASEAGPFLRRRPVENSVLLTVASTLRRNGLDSYGEPPLFGWWRDADGLVAAAFLCTPPFPPLLARGTPEAARELAAALDGPLSGVRGESATVREFAAAWRERTGTEARTDRELRLYRLGTLLPPLPAPPGRARVAGPADRGLLLRWQEGYFRDIGQADPGGERLLDDALAYGGRTLWEVDGEPVAMAGVTPPEDGAVRVVSVYTPPELRGRGYAGAATAAVTETTLAAGTAQVLLFTNLADPVANRLYARLGYVPVEDQIALAFDSAP
ncbi:GNAT family N-acetyltransferase [Actinacidiphila yeochonensis]|uniref:GNAT family N-acetyltransferase n=1 Tax=Actinacidiphila yeochonensis TaxID=89050 RepID=UPI0005685A25|nr:GNAT family N-acetyltransferase [Actinacidiphila yeochonensis]